MIEIVNYTKEYEADWTAYVEQSAGTTVSHQIGWRTVLEKCLGHKGCYLMALENGKIRGVLPLFLVTTWWRTRYMVSIPWLDYGGIVADTVEIEEKLLEYACRLAEQEKAEHLELRSMQANLEATIHRTDKVTFLLDLSKGEETLWKNFDAKLRNQIRKSQKSGLTVKFGRDELLDQFYAVFSRNMRDLGTPVWGRDLFAEVLSTFGERARFIVVMKDHDTVAAGLVLSFGSQLYVPSASSYRSARAYCPNHTLYWEVIKQACREGFAYFDFGRSTKEAPTYRFKKQWVPDPLQLVWQYQLIRGTEAPSADSQDRKYRLMIDLWKKLPVPIANLLGPRVIRNFP